MTIDTAIRAYLERPNTQHAVMINGEWGVGKTHYVVRELMPSLPDLHFCYISAYGMQSVQELKQAVDERLAESSDDETASRYVICLDDLERWHGNLELCLSYINLLAEHEGRKCLLIGNIQEFSAKNAAVFAKAQEKTIRQLFQFNRSLPSVIKIALDQVDYPSKSSRKFMRALVKKNEQRLVELMCDVSLYNIRLVSESFQLFAYACRAHATAFKASKKLTFTWYLALLSVLVLVKRNLISEEQQLKLFQDDHSKFHGCQFLSRIGYFDNSDSSQLSDITQRLLDTIFFRLDKIRLGGIFSLVRHGYYIAADFRQDFSNWDESDYIQTYLDREEFYSLDDQQAQTLFDRVYRDLTVLRIVRSPLTVLFLSERIVEDIANAVIDINPVDFRRQVIAIVDSLYQAETMEPVIINIFDISGERFVNCKVIHHYITEKNQLYLAHLERDRQARFWTELKSPDVDVSALLDQYNPVRVLSETPSASVLTGALEQLDNHDLKEVAHWLTNDNGIDLTILVTAQSVIHQAMLDLKEAYTNELGVRANHFRSVVRALSHLDELADGTLPPNMIQIHNE